jgi:hypothetical protein
VQDVHELRVEPDIAKMRFAVPPEELRESQTCAILGDVIDDAPPDIWVNGAPVLFLEDAI